MGFLGTAAKAVTNSPVTPIIAPIALGSARNAAGNGAVGKSIDTYFGLQKTLGVLQGINDTKSAIKDGAARGNAYDNRLGTNSFPRKRNTWAMQKYSAFKMPGMNKSKKELSNKERAEQARKRAKAVAIGTGATLGAICIASALSTGNALAPIESLIGGVKKTPGNMFNKAKGYAFGPAAGIAANGIDKAVRGTKVPDTGSLYNLRKANKTSFSSNPQGSPKAVMDSTNSILSGVAQGLAMAVGTYGAQAIARNIKKGVDKTR